MAELGDYLKDREKDGLLRTLRPVVSRCNGRIVVEGKEYLDLSSNDYLGLSEHPLIKEACIKAVERFGSGSSASRLMTGDSELYHQLEERTAGFKNKEAALAFNSGYQANVGIISSLFGRGDAVFCDRLAHASIIDGILLSGVRLFRFQHNDATHLEKLLKDKRKDFKKCLIVTESVFSMDGDVAPLEELVRLKEKYDCSFMVDEAHATGVFGSSGAGIVEMTGLADKIDLIMGTFSKALGGFGAYLAASKEVVGYLVNTCRSFIYSTALPPSVIAGNLAALNVVQQEPWRRKQLLETSRCFRQGLKDAGVSTKGSSQIVPVMIGDNFKAISAAKELGRKGYWVLAVRPPTVPAGQARLRFSLSVYYSKETIQKLTDDIIALGI
ncbi:MAG TPA: 8-amino-7-oxononanoate synthase [Candidatus Omnitrophica bacterium]|nr:8-amino-7-oxononanoate synthase [Candidatus Omnitrophota bacterium]